MIFGWKDEMITSEQNWYCEYVLSWETVAQEVELKTGRLLVRSPAQPSQVSACCLGPAATATLPQISRRKWLDGWIFFLPLGTGSCRIWNSHVWDRGRRRRRVYKRWALVDRCLWTLARASPCGTLLPLLKHPLFMLQIEYEWYSAGKRWMNIAFLQSSTPPRHCSMYSQVPLWKKQKVCFTRFKRNYCTGGHVYFFTKTSMVFIKLLLFWRCALTSCWWVGQFTLFHRKLFKKRSWHQTGGHVEMTAVWPINTTWAHIFQTILWITLYRFFIQVFTSSLLNELLNL